MSPVQIVVGLFVGGLVVAFVVGLRRMGWLGGDGRRASSGLAGGMGAINEILQPQQPSVQALAEAKEQEEEDEDEGDDVGPDRARRPSSR